MTKTIFQYLDVIFHLCWQVTMLGVELGQA